MEPYTCYCFFSTIIQNVTSQLSSLLSYRFVLILQVPYQVSSKRDIFSLSSFIYEITTADSKEQHGWISDVYAGCSK